MRRSAGAAIKPPSTHVAGAEAVQAAAAATLRPGFDWVVPHGRDLAMCLALGVAPLDVMLAVFGRAADPTSAGRLAPPSVGSRRARILTTSALLGPQVVHAAGLAYASRLRGLDEITLVSIDARATDTGDWHEGLNFAAVHRLPLICLLQDGGAQAGPIEPPDPERLAGRARGYGVAATAVDGSDFDASFKVLARAVDRARSQEGPTVVHASVPEPVSRTPEGAFLPPERVEALARHDPIERMRVRLDGAGLLDGMADLRVQRDCMEVVEAALAQALEAATPEPALSLDNVFRR
jgi:2-oxoisovalerate dehydrogenase E1 component alpha subunit